jgi:hypothetical protein
LYTSGKPLVDRGRCLGLTLLQIAFEVEVRSENSAKFQIYLYVYIDSGVTINSKPGLAVMISV